MALYFFDTSALVKRYSLEDGRKWVQGVTDPAAANRIYLARITGAEVMATIMRNVREGDTTPAAAAKVMTDFRYDFTYQYQIIEITEAVITRAMALIETHPLKGYDAVQLAAAVEINSLILAIGMPMAGMPALTFASADKQLNRAAAAEGLTVENPQDHLDPHDNTP